MASKSSKIGLRSSANGHTELQANKGATKQEKVVILDAGAQYGKVSMESLNWPRLLWGLHSAVIQYVLHIFEFHCVGNKWLSVWSKCYG